LIVLSGDNDVATVPNIFPDPGTDADADWIWRAVLVAAPGTLAGNSFQLMDWQGQSKAKRRIGTGEGLAIVLENDSTVVNSLVAEARFLVQSK